MSADSESVIVNFHRNRIDSRCARGLKRLSGWLFQIVCVAIDTHVTHACVILCVKTCKVKVSNAIYVFVHSFASFIRQMTLFSTEIGLKNYLIAFSIQLQPGESGFVLLGDLTVETSTDPEPDDTWICDPPSPCDVQFKNANVVINGKSSLRDKSRNDQKVSACIQSDWMPTKQNQRFVIIQKQNCVCFLLFILHSVRLENRS